MTKTTVSARLEWTSNPPLDQQLALLQLSDSFFPSGSYTLSHGLESLVQSGDMASAQALESFVRILLCNKVGSMDLVALSHAHQASQHHDMTQLEKIDALLYAQTPVEKTRIAQRQSGRALLMVAAKTWAHALLDELSDRSSQGTLHCLHPVVFAAVAQGRRVVGAGSAVGANSLPGADGRSTRMHRALLHERGKYRRGGCRDGVRCRR